MMSRKARLLKRCWFENVAERIWFCNQFQYYYPDTKRAVLLFALRRLSLVYNLGICHFGAHRRLCSFKEELRHPSWDMPFAKLRIKALDQIRYDYEDANELFDYHKLPLIRFSNVITTMDYVSLVSTLEQVLRKYEKLHVYDFLR